MTEMGRPYLRTAKAKGLSEFQIVRKHLLPNIYSKMINALAVSIPMGISSIALVEYIYNYNGMFNLMFASIYNYNFPILHAGALYIGVFTFILMTFSNSFAKFMDKLQAAK